MDRAHHWLFSSNNIYFCKYQNADEKKSKEDEQALRIKFGSSPFTRKMSVSTNQLH